MSNNQEIYEGSAGDIKNETVGISFNALFVFGILKTNDMFASRTNAAWGKNRAAQPSTFFIVFNLFLDSLGLFRIVFQRFRIVLVWFGL